MYRAMRPRRRPPAEEPSDPRVHLSISRQAILRILLASPISPRAVDALRSRHELIDAVGQPEGELRRLIAGCDALVFRSGVQITAPVMESSPELRLIVRGGSGTDNIDMDYVERRGLRLVRVPGPGAQAVAEMAFALILGLARQLVIADAALREGHWIKHEVRGHLLQGKTLGVYGAGNIGFKVAQMGAAWGMRVLACVQNPTPERERSFREQGIELQAGHVLLSESDYLSIHVPLNAATTGLIRRPELEKMKAGAFLVTLARGGVVDEDALFEALESGRLAGAGLDVHAREGEGEVSRLAALPNVILTPHIGATTVDTQDIIGAKIVEIIDGFGSQ